jgi:hypothetical protein
MIAAPGAGARQVHAVLAAGVENPALIARWRAQPELLRGHGVEPGEVDLDALWKFAGLTTKVRHNGLRDDYPLTFRVMSAIGIEIDLFAAYAGERAAAGARLAPTTEQRVIDLMAFLERWLDRAQPSHALLWDAIRHERALAELAKPQLGAPEPPRPRAPTSMEASPAGRGAARRSTEAQGARATARTVPRVHGQLVLHEMTCDPRTIVGALTTAAPRLDQIARAPTYLCYWRADATPAIAIVQLDELGYYALSLIDGRHSAAALHRALGLTGKTSAAVLRGLEQLAGLGIITLRAPRAS